MILTGSQRAGASALADHLMNDRENDHVEVLEIGGFMSDDLHGALQEAHAISKATKCKQYLFSLSLNPPQDVVLSEDAFREAADRAEEKLGLKGQPRAIIIHEKQGRRHAHVVWSRIDAESITAINLPHFKNRLRDLSRELFLDHGWEMPLGLATYGGKNPLNFTLAEWQQAKRQGIDPREIKQIFRQAWERSDGLTGLRHALEERGFHLAKGDRRGIVAIDIQGEVYSLSRWTGIKTKDVRLKCGNGDELESVSTVQGEMRKHLTQQLRGFIQQFKNKQKSDLVPFENERAAMVSAHRHERKRMRDKQDERERLETRARLDRLNKGLRGIFDRLTGKHSRVKEQNLRDAMICLRRDQEQREALILEQMRERKELRRRYLVVAKKQSEERKIMARDVTAYLRRSNRPAQAPDHAQQRQRRPGLDLGR